MMSSPSSAPLVTTKRSDIQAAVSREALPDAKIRRVRILVDRQACALAWTAASAQKSARTEKCSCRAC